MGICWCPQVLVGPCIGMIYWSEVYDETCEIHIYIILLVMEDNIYIYDEYIDRESVSLCIE